MSFTALNFNTALFKACAANKMTYFTVLIESKIDILSIIEIVFP